MSASLTGLTSPRAEPGSGKAWRLWRHGTLRGRPRAASDASWRRS